MQHGKKEETAALESLIDRLEEDTAADVSAAELPAAVEESAAPEVRRGEARSELLRGVRLRVRVELGRRRMHLRDALALAPGAVVELGKGARDLVEILVGDVPIARGEVLVVDGRFCVRVSQVLASPEEGEPS